MTPKSIDKDVEKLLDKLDATHEPIYIKVSPEVGAKINDCFIIVREKVKNSGGRMILGWQIWKTKYLIEAEFHAVWENPDADLIDLTPKEGDIEKILFVEDENSVYEEKQVENIRLNISTNELVDDLINVCKAIHRFNNRGNRAELYEGDFIASLDATQIKHITYLTEMQSIISLLLSNKGRRTSPCPCGRGIKFKECHGKNLSERVSKVV